MDFKSQVVLKETCAGRILVLGVNDTTGSLVDALRQLDRVHEVRIIDPVWDEVKRFHGLDKVTLATEELEDALDPPVEEFDLAVVSNEDDTLKDFVERVVPLVFSLVNRGWVERGERVMIDELTLRQSQLAEFLHAEIDRVVADADYLEHVCTQKTSSEIKLLVRPFFQAMRRVGDYRDTCDLNTWVEAFVSVAFFPGGAGRFDDFVEAQ